MQTSELSAANIGTFRHKHRNFLPQTSELSGRLHADSGKRLCTSCKQPSVLQEVHFCLLANRRQKPRTGKGGQQGSRLGNFRPTDAGTEEGNATLRAVIPLRPLRFSHVHQTVDHGIYDDVGEGTGMEFVHDVLAMTDDCGGRDGQNVSDFLVDAALCQQSCHLNLPW